MITKHCRIIVVLLALALLVSTPVSGQRKATVKIFVHFAVLLNESNSWTVRLKNTGTSTIPKGKMIRWSLCPGFTRSGEGNAYGSFPLQSGLTAGQSFVFGVSPPPCSGTEKPKAWYFR